MKTYISIDIGKSGYFCVINEIITTTVPMPKIGKETDYHGINEILKHYSAETVHVVFERLTSLHLASKKANWSLAHQAGAIEGIVIALGLPFTPVSPRVWQKEMLQGIPEMKDSAGKRDTKAMALLAVRRIFPNQNLLRTEKCSKPDDGMVDALLINAYAKRQNL